MIPHPRFLLATDEEYLAATGPEVVLSWLSIYTLPSLRTLCRSRNLFVKDSVSRSKLSSLLATELFRGSSISALLSDLKSEEKSVLKLLREHGGVLSSNETSEFIECEDTSDGLRRLVSRGLVLPGGFRTAQIEQSPPAPAGAFDVSAPAGPVWCPEPILRMSEDLHPLESLVAFSEEVVDIQKGDFRALEHDLLVMASEIHRSPVRRLKSGFPGKRFLARVAPQLRTPVDSSGIKRMETSGRLLQLYEMLDVLGLLRARHDRITTAHTIGSYFVLEPEERIRRMLDAWKSLSWYNELYIVPELDLERDFPDYEHSDGKANDLPSVEKLHAAREFILDCLTNMMPPEEWVTLDDLLGAAYLTNDRFLMKEPHSYFYAHSPLYQGIWSADDPDAGGLWSGGLERAGNWRTVEGSFISQVFTGGLFYLGLVDKARTRDGRVVVRLNDVGAWAVSGSQKPSLGPDEGRSLIVQPNFDVIVFPEGQDVSILWPLLQTTDVIGQDITLMLRLTPDTMYRASQRGITAGVILDLLRRHARTPIPDNVEQAVNDWESRHQQITITTGVELVEARSVEEFESFIDELNSNRTLIRKLTDTVGLVTGPSSSMPSMGILDYTDTLPPCLEISDDLELRIEPTSEYWSIRRQLEVFSEKTGPHTWRLTKGSVADAVSKGCTYDETLELLQSASAEEIPVRAIFKLQGLFGYLGPVAVGEATVMQVNREDILSTMLEIDDFRTLILSRLGPTSVLVEPSRVDELIQTMESFGIICKESDVQFEGVQARRVNRSQPENETATTRGSGRRILDQTVRKTRDLLEEAIRRRRRIRLRYRMQTGSRIQERSVDPIEIEVRHEVAYLVAYCRLRSEVQVFRLTLIEEVEILDSSTSGRKS